MILAHENAHLRAGDARINAVAAAALCACWFNPLVHMAVYLMRLDQELACDAAVLDRFPRARRLYAEVLLKTQLAAQPLPFGCHWPAAPTSKRACGRSHRASACSITRSATCTAAASASWDTARWAGKWPTLAAPSAWR